jgi:hypothetical protein
MVNPYFGHATQVFAPDPKPTGCAHAVKEKQTVMDVRVVNVYSYSAQVAPSVPVVPPDVQASVPITQAPNAPTPVLSTTARAPAPAASSAAPAAASEPVRLLNA